MSNRSYHWVMTLQVPSPRGLAHVSEEGTIDLAPNETRQSAYYKILEFMRDKARKQGFPTNGGGVLFWSLEPNTL